MRQCTLVRPGKVNLADVEIPEPSNGELLIKVRAALTCGTDLKAFIRGHPVVPMPGPFGHEFSGVVEKKGRGARGFKEGDAVMAVHSAPCLKCPFCKKRIFNLCERIMDTKVLGAFSEYLLLPSHVVRQNVYRKPKSLPFEEAALLEPLSCVVHGLEPLGIKRGDNALVIGAGPIGLLHLMLLKARGASVAVTDIKASRLRTARRLGADIAKGPERTDAAIKKLTHHLGFDYVFECTGRPEVWESSINHARRGGTLVLFGGCPPGTTVTYDTSRLHYDEITIKGSFHFTPSDVKTAHGLLARGKLKTGELISGEYPLSGVEKALGRLKKGEGIKYAIVP
jgi:L-iditol 2-dehydrogenase